MNINEKREIKILVAEDYKFTQDLIVSILQKGGYTVIGRASDGVKAVDSYRELQPDLVTMDMNMPGMNGLQAIQALIALDSDAKIIAVTGYRDVEEKAMELGAVGFLQKPFHPNHLLELVEKILEQPDIIAPVVEEPIYVEPEVENTWIEQEESVEAKPVNDEPIKLSKEFINIWNLEETELSSDEDDMVEDTQTETIPIEDNSIEAIPTESNTFEDDLAEDASMEIEPIEEVKIDYSTESLPESEIILRTTNHEIGIPIAILSEDDDEEDDLLSFKKAPVKPSVGLLEEEVPKIINSEEAEEAEAPEINFFLKPELNQSEDTSAFNTDDEDKPEIIKEATEINDEIIFINPLFVRENELRVEVEPVNDVPNERAFSFTEIEDDDDFFVVPYHGQISNNSDENDLLPILSHPDATHSAESLLPDVDVDADDMINSMFQTKSSAYKYTKIKEERPPLEIKLENAEIPDEIPQIIPSVNTQSPISEEEPLIKPPIGFIHPVNTIDFSKMNEHKIPHSDSSWSEYSDDFVETPKKVGFFVKIKNLFSIKRNKKKRD